VGAASGRVDALVFMGGMIAGIWVFAEAYAALAGFVWSGEMGDVTFADLLGVPFWLLAAALVVMALGMFWLLRKLERPSPRGKS
jgi:hypothetical protein